MSIRKIQYGALLAVVLLIGVLHFVTPGQYMFFHDTYRRLSYFPIVVGGLLFGLRGGVSLAVLSSIAFIPHLLLLIGQAPQAYLSELTEIILYISAGAVTGLIAGRGRRLRERYRQLSEKLEASYESLQEQTAQLIEAEKHLAEVQKFSALGQMSASLAHEIKNPLGSIKGTAEILLDDYPVGHPKREFVDILLKETDRLNQTVEDVLRFSRRKPGALGMQEPFADVVARAETLLTKQFRGKKIKFSVLGLEDAAGLSVVSDKMIQVLLNLLLNAYDAVGVGGEILLRIEPSPKGNPESSGDAGYLIVICDNGPGIPEELWDKVFEPFVTEKDGGTGLGLYISRKILESFDGSLFLSKCELSGASFSIFLPISDEKDEISGSRSADIFEEIS
jgi:signal transduction histidine kinase